MGKGRLVGGFKLHEKNILVPEHLVNYVDTLILRGITPLRLPYINHGSSFSIGTEWLQR
jgi:hypothetical protein